MSPTPPSTTSSSIGAHSPDGQYRIVRKRNRVPVSCAPCRNRKLKCNRGLPCENCVKRSDGPSCTYAQPKTRKKPTSNQDPPVTPDGMQNRIDRLEGLVLSLMTNGAQSVGPAAAQAALSGESTSSTSRQDTQELGFGDEMDGDEEESDTEQVTKSFGVMKVDAKTQKSYYVSEAHWMMVLNDISEVKQYFITHKKQYEEHIEKIQAANNEPHFAAPPLIFGAMKPPSEKEILSNFPSKYTTDILISRYFDHYDPFTHFIHVPSFKKEYERHWEDPSKTSIVWIGMVFAMLRLAFLTYHDESDEPPEFRGKSRHMASTYRNSMAQCLVLADYTKPHCFLMEALVLHLHGDYSQVNESEVSVWVLIGVIVRLAMRMGYHRDAKMFPNISVFQGEMRRRMWAFIRQADLLLSFQVGLPSMIRTGDYDTEFPRNLYDTDIDEDTVKLPPERPLVEPAEISFLIVKARVAFAFGRVLETTQKVTGSSYEEVMELDHQLRQARDMIPERMAIKPLAECNEPVHVTKSRFVIGSIYHKAQCVLHRRFLHRSRENPRYAYSRRTCIDSAMELLRFQNMLQSASKVDNRLQSTKGYITTTSTHDFLMAGTILALDIYQLIQEKASGRTSSDTFALGRDRYQEELAVLRRSRDIWNEVKDQSVDAWRATAIMDVMLGKLFPNQSQQEQNRSNTGTTAGPSVVPSVEGPFAPQDEKQNAAMTLGLLSTGLNQMGSTGSPPQFSDTDLMRFEAISGFGGVTNQGGMIDPTQLPTPGGIGLGTGIGILGQMPTMQPFNLDWETWDNYVQTATTDPNSQGWPMFDMQGFSPGPLQPSPPSPQPPTLPQQQQHQPHQHQAHQAHQAHQPHQPHQPHLSHQQPHEQQTRQGTTGGKSLFSMQHNIFDALGRDGRISLRHAAFRAISAAPAAFAVKPGTLAALTPSFLRLSGQVPKVAFQQRWNWNSSHDEAQPYGRRNDRQNYRQNDRQNDRRNDSYRERDNLPLKPNETIYVGNLFFEVTAEDLKRDLSKFGTIHSVRIVYDSRGMSRGFAYIQFDSISAAEAAIAELNMSVYEGRRIVVNFSARSTSAPKSQASEPTKTIFVGNLSFEMTDRELNDLFKDIPNVRDVRVSVDKRTGRPRGFCHADFLDVESSKAAMEILKEKAPYGRPLRLDYSLNTKDMTSDRSRGSPLEDSKPEETFQSEATETEDANSEHSR